MPSTPYPLLIEQGVPFVLSMRVIDDNIPRDFTGFTAAMQVRPSADSPTLLLDLKSPLSIKLSAEGHVEVEVDHLTTAKLTACAAGNEVRKLNLKDVLLLGYYDLKLTDPAGVPDRVLEGPVFLSMEVTRNGH